MRKGRNDQGPKEEFWDHSRWTEQGELDDEVRDRLSQVKSREIFRHHQAPRPDPEFSGLVDIRALASATREEIQVDGNAITLTGLPTAAARPPLLPLRQGGIGTGTKVGLGALAIAAAALLALIGVLLFGSRGEPATPEPPATQQLAALMFAAADLPSAGELAPPAPSVVPAKADEPRPAEQAPATRARRNQTKSATARPAKRAERAERSRKIWRNDELDALLGGAAEPRKKARSKRERSSDRQDDRPATLSRAQVRSGLIKVAPRVKRKCGKGRDGTVMVEVVIGKNGRVARSRPTGGQAGTGLGKCVARAARKAKFPRFSGQRITVKYPFRL